MPLSGKKNDELFALARGFFPIGLSWENSKTMDFFSETIVIYDLKLATDDRSDKKFLLEFGHLGPTATSSP